MSTRRHFAAGLAGVGPEIFAALEAATAQQREGIELIERFSPVDAATVRAHPPHIGTIRYGRGPSADQLSPRID